MKGRIIGKVVLHHGYRLNDVNALKQAVSGPNSNSNPVSSRTIMHLQSNIASGTFIITGGLGGLGLLTAKVLVSLGVQNIVLLSRSGNVSRAGQGLEDMLSWLQHDSGAHVQTQACDVTNEAMLVGLFESIRSSGGYIGELRIITTYKHNYMQIYAYSLVCILSTLYIFFLSDGIIHTAAVLQDSLLQSGSVSSFISQVNK